MNKKITREIFLYILFGGMTTAVNVVSYWVFYYGIELSNTSSTAFAWFLSVIFAYITNRIWVFESKNENAVKEAFGFFLSRGLTGALDVLIMYVFVDVLLFAPMAIKIISNVVVIILNYLASKLLVFKKR